MLYQESLTIPPNTDSNVPVSQDMELLPGTITKIEILFPPGCNGLAHLEIYQKIHKLWPSSPDASFFGDTYPISWNEDYEVNEIPYSLTLLGWNLDNLYPHTVTVRIAMLTGSDGWADYLAKLIGKPIG